jgi:uncharacterized protein (TIGR02266 family)
MQSNKAPVPPPSGREQRVHPRAALSVEVGLHTHDNFYAGVSGDVSAGGIFVATYDPPPIGQEVELTIALPDAQPIVAVGEVRWLREQSAALDGNSPGCGIAWRRITPEALDAIRRFVAQRDTLLFEA